MTKSTEEPNPLTASFPNYQEIIAFKRSQLNSIANRQAKELTLWNSLAIDLEKALASEEKPEVKTKVIKRKLDDLKVEVVRIRKDSEPQNTQEEDEQEEEENPNNKTVIHKVGFLEEAEIKIMSANNEEVYDSSWDNQEASGRMSSRTPIFSGKFNENIDD
jgi:hypothetical protein